MTRAKYPPTATMLLATVRAMRTVCVRVPAASIQTHTALSVSKGGSATIVRRTSTVRQLFRAASAIPDRRCVSVFLDLW